MRLNMVLRRLKHLDEGGGGRPCLGGYAIFVVFQVGRLSGWLVFKEGARKRRRAMACEGSKKDPSFHELLDAPDRLFVRLVHGYLHVFWAIFRCNCQAKRAIF